MSKKIPDRWINYTPIGKVVANSSFIAFKVPLHRHICERLPSEERHTTQDVIDSIPRLGLVINLTNTQNDTKYYQPSDWERYGVEYKWIRTEGHVTPPPSQLLHFCLTVRNFLQANPEKLVGVHCTHGLNRTGYFVCSYMVLCNNLSPSDVLRNFAVARGHPIERPNYINDIMMHGTNEQLKRAATSNVVNPRFDRHHSGRWEGSLNNGRWEGSSNRGRGATSSDRGGAARSSNRGGAARSNFGRTVGDSRPPPNGRPGSNSRPHSNARPHNNDGLHYNAAGPAANARAAFNARAASRAASSSRPHVNPAPHVNPRTHLNPGPHLNSVPVANGGPTHLSRRNKSKQSKKASRKRKKVKSSHRIKENGSNRLCVGSDTMGLTMALGGASG